MRIRMWPEALLFSAFVWSTLSPVFCQESQPPPSQQKSQGGEDEPLKSKIHILKSYHYLSLEPVAGIKAKTIVYDSESVPVKGVRDRDPRRRFEQLKKDFQVLYEQRKDALDAEPRATQFKKEVGDLIQNILATFETLRRHGLATSKDLDETFSIALAWPQVTFVEVVADVSREETDRGNRILNLVKDSPERGTTIDYLKAGRRLIVRDLVLGTVRVSFDHQISVGTPSQLKLEFEPHAILSDKVVGKSPSEQVVQWHVRPEYHPRQIGATYDFVQSGRKPEQRNLDLRANNKETWSWTIPGLRNFKTDTSDLIFYLGYHSSLGDSKETDAWREAIQWVENSEPEKPGAMAVAWSWLRTNVNWGLGILAAVTTIWASVKTIQLRRLELIARDLDQDAQPDAQPVQSAHKQEQDDPRPKPP